MSSIATKIGNDFKFEVGSGTSPETFAAFCAVVDPGNVGEAKPLIDVTALCDQAREYRGGLPDGASIPLKCNFIQGDTVTHTLFTAYKNGTTKNYRLQIDGVSPAEYFAFAAVITGWSMTVQTGNKVDITFTLKISGPVTWVHA